MIGKLKTNKMIDKIKINKFIFGIFLIVCLLPTNAFAQKITDEELGFNRDVIKKELLSKKLVPTKDIDIYIDKLREEAVLKFKLGFNNWLENKKTTNNLLSKYHDSETQRFSGCEDYTFNDPVYPIINWTFSNNITPFEYGDSFNELVTTNLTGNSFLNDIGGNRFQALSNTYTDPFLGAIPANVMKVGNEGTGFRKEMISRNILVTDPKDFIVYKFAIVLQDPDHPSRPFYSIVLRRANGTIINCSVVNYEANSNIPGFQLFPNSNVWIRPWATNVIKPVDFGVTIGETISIEISVSDCGGGGHFGYGYFDVKCLNEEDMILNNGNECVNNEITFSSELDSTLSGLSWTIKDQNGTPIPIQNPNAPTLTHVFSDQGNYLVELNVPYFTTSGQCSITSVFKKELIINDCEPCVNCASFDLVRSTDTETSKYLVSGWVKEEYPSNVTQQFKNYSEGAISISFKDINGALINTPSIFKASGEIIDGWQRIIGEFIVPQNVDDMLLELVNESADSKMVYFDDIRVIPSKGNMKSFVYDQKTQRLMAELDENNYSTFYEYDLEGGLIRIKKETEKGVFTIQETRSGNRKNN